MCNVSARTSAVNKVGLKQGVLVFAFLYVSTDYFKFSGVVRKKITLDVHEIMFFFNKQQLCNFT